MITFTEALDAAAVRRVLSGAARHYVYVLLRPDLQPFYVGKGVDLRVLQHEAEARTTKTLTHKLNVIHSLRARGQAVGYWIDSSFEEEALALERERALIAQIGRHDLRLGPLTNQTDGGEGASNPSEESRQRRRDSLGGIDAADPEQRAANRFFQELTPVGSVPIKPVASFTRASGLWKNDDTIGMRPRQAATIVASAIANRILLEAGALIPRRLEIGDVGYIMENGVGRDMVSNGMVTIADNAETHEVLRLSDAGFRYVLSVFNRSKLVDAGVLSPDL